MVRWSHLLFSGYISLRIMHHRPGGIHFHNTYHSLKRAGPLLVKNREIFRVTNLKRYQYVILLKPVQPRLV